MIAVGHVVYRANKNYRSKLQFEKFRKENRVDIPATLMLFEDEDDVRNMLTLDNLFINKGDEILDKYGTMKMFGYVKKPRLRKNGKEGRSFKVERQKRFIIPLTRLMYRDDDGSVKYCNSLSVHCTFRQKLL